jgi:hypothetical protein
MAFRQAVAHVLTQCYVSKFRAAFIFVFYSTLHDTSPVKNTEHRTVIELTDSNTSQQSKALKFANLNQRMQ